ncbi:MAG: hypothetical protein ABIT38_05380 [Gemmatimonadaceae bacterium]
MSSRFAFRIVSLRIASTRAVFRRALIDPSRIMLTGFSDGGTYTLAVVRAIVEEVVRKEANG